MTISVAAMDHQADVPGSGFPHLKIPTLAWTGLNRSTDAGKVTLILMNGGFERYLPGVRRRMFFDLPLPFLGSISGVITESGSPVARTVRLYRRSDGQPAGVTVSDAGTGAYSFTRLLVGEEFYVIAFDNTALGEDFNAIIWDVVVAA